ncbi:MAG: glutaredoxin family protein [Williamsia sp.]|nr:glutaredoxin family protein [Williamsia sp.]
MTVTVYSTPNCVQCKATYRALDKLEIPHVSVDLATDDVARTRLRDELGYTQAPVVVAGDEHWCGYRPDRIKGVTAEVRQVDTPAPDPPTPSREGVRIIGGLEIPEYTQPDLSAVEAWMAISLDAARSAGQVPELGSPQWVEMSNNDPRKLGAVMAAAASEVRARHALPTRVRTELDSLNADYREAIGQANDAVAAELRGRPTGPSFAELQRRRYGDRASEVTAIQRVANDFPTNSRPQSTPAAAAHFRRVIHAPARAGGIER